MPLVITNKVAAKLKRADHNVTEKEILQCFMNREGCLLKDTREHHRTRPPTLWFIAPTNQQRLLKIVYIQDGANIIIKTAYQPSAAVIELYKKKALS